MNAQEALNMSQKSLPSEIEKEYNKIIAGVKVYAYKGKTSFNIGFNLPRKEVCEMLKEDGYRFYYTDYIYSISWKPKKVKWYHKLFKL